MYKYEKERPEIFTERGTKMLVHIYQKIVSSPNGLITVGDTVNGLTGDSFLMLACIDYLKEQNIIDVAERDGWTQGDIIVLRRIEP